LAGNEIAQMNAPPNEKRNEAAGVEENENIVKMM
jgi:hypothetical protein